MIIPVHEIEGATYLLEDGLWVCQHDSDIEVEDVEVDTMRNGEHDTYTVKAAFCSDCGEEVEYNFEEDFND